MTGVSLLGIVATTAWFISEYYKYQKSSSEPDDSGNPAGAHGRLLTYIVHQFPSVAKRAWKAKDALMKLGGFFFTVKNYVWNSVRRWARSQANRLGPDVAAELEAGVTESRIDLTADEDSKREADAKTRANVVTPPVSEDTPPDEEAEIMTTPAVMKKLIGALESVDAKELELELEGYPNFHVSDVSFSTDGKIFGITG